MSVRSGDLIFGDADGVVVIPQRVEAEVLDLAFKKVAESATRFAIFRLASRSARFSRDTVFSDAICASHDEPAADPLLGERAPLFALEEGLAVHENFHVDLVVLERRLVDLDAEPWRVGDEDFAGGVRTM